MDAMSYEILIRRAYHCGRYGSKGADADIYRRMEDAFNRLNANDLRVPSVEPGHGQDMEVEKALSWSLKDVIQLNPNAWKSTATLNFESCNSATDGSLGTNLAQVASKRLQIKTTGWLSTCSYEGIYGPGDGGTNVHAAKNAVSEGDSGVKKTYEKGKNK